MAVVDTKEPASRRVIDRLLTSGSFEAILATLAVALAGIFIHLKDHPREALLLDVPLFVAAALTARYPRAAGVALGAGLAALLLIPSSWATLGRCWNSTVSLQPSPSKVTAGCFRKNGRASWVRRPARPSPI